MRLYTRVAEIAQHELKSPERAAKAYERILAIDAENADGGATRWCRSIARARSGRACSPPTRSSSARTRSGRTPTPTRRWRCTARSSSCARRSWARSALAFAWAAKAYQLRPTDAGLQKNLERLAAEAEAWEELAEIYQAEVAQGDRRRAQDRALSPAGAHRAARGCTSPRRRASYFEEVLQRAPDDDRGARQPRADLHAGGELQGAARDLPQARGARHRSAAAPGDAVQDRLDRGGAARRSGGGDRHLSQDPRQRPDAGDADAGAARAREAERGARRRRPAWPTCSSGSWCSPTRTTTTRGSSCRIGSARSTSST